MAPAGAPAAPLLLQSQEGEGVAAAVRTGAQHRLVAAQLHVPPGQNIHQPDAGVEPVEAQGSGQKPFAQGVETPDVGVLVFQNIGQPGGIRQVHPFRQEHHRIDRAVGQGRGNPVTEADLDRSEQGVVLLPVADKGVVQGQGHGVNPAAAQVPPQKPGGQERPHGGPGQQREIHRRQAEASKAGRGLRGGSRVDGGVLR